MSTTDAARPAATRTWRPEWPVPVVSVLLQQRRGTGDPTMRLDVAGRHWRATRTSAGPAALAVRVDAAAAEVHAEAWGSGADWVLEHLPALLGADDDWEGFEPRHPFLAEARRRHPHHRLGRSLAPFEALVAAIIEQKVTGKQAFSGHRLLVRRYGEPAPGPGARAGLRLPPTPATIAAVPSWEWLQMGIDGARARTLVHAAGRAASIDRHIADAVALDRALRSLPGVGIWTSAEVRQRALGDPDAVSFGDYHVAKDVGWALTGEEFDDRRLAEYLEPWRPQRGRVPFLVAAARGFRPRHGPRMPVPDHVSRVTK